MVFPSRRKVIFVHGCFWHQHPGCREGRVPGSRREYWGPKLARNQARDAENLSELEEMGWGVLTVWECSLRESRQLTRTLRRFLGRL
jgi:DNA mismatch endonuclease (patch repair protein)